MVLCVSNSIGGEENQEFEYILGFMSKSLSPNKGTNISEQKRCRKNVNRHKKGHTCHSTAKSDSMVNSCRHLSGQEEPGGTLHFHSAQEWEFQPEMSGKCNKTSPSAKE